MQSIQDNILGAEGYNSNNNWIREQWIANLKKKQRNQCFETSMDVFTPSYGSGEGPFAKYSAQASDQERLHLDGIILNNLECFAHVCVSPSSLGGPMGSTRHPVHNVAAGSKKTLNTLFKKRTNHTSIGINEPRPRTPRRKLNCGSVSFDNDDARSPNQEKIMNECDASIDERVEILHDMNQPWADPKTPLHTCWNLATSKCADLLAEDGLYGEAWDSASMLNEESNLKLIRTASFDQEGLRQVFEQTHLSGSSSFDHSALDAATGAFNEISSTSSNQKDDVVDILQGDGLLNSPSLNSDIQSPSLTAAITAGYIPNDGNQHEFDLAEFDNLVADCKFLEFDNDLNYLNLVSYMLYDRSCQSMQP